MLEGSRSRQKDTAKTAGIGPQSENPRVTGSREVRALDLGKEKSKISSMKATLTSKGQITLPVAIRRRLGLQPGDVLEFDETVPYIKAHKPFSREQMRAVIGRGKGRTPKRPSSEWVEELRGPVDLP